MEYTNIAKALNAFQSELVKVNKGAENPFFKSKYADLASIMLAAQPILTKHGLSVVQFPTNIDGQPALRTMVMHTSGEYLEDTMPLMMSKQDPQGQGSAITYARRYSYAAALQIVIDEDDDGNKASQPRQEYKKKVTDYPMTDKQKVYIASLLEQKNVEKDDMVAYVADNYGMDLKTLTVESAKELIDSLV